MVGEWDVTFDLITPAGTLPLNQTDPTTLRRYQLVPEACSVTLPVRTTEDDRPQGDGAIPHRRWRSGFGVHLALELVIDNAGELTAACGADLVEMLDELGLHVNEMIRTGIVQGLPNARLVWPPTGASDDRMFDRLQLSGAPSLNVVEGDIGPRYEVDFDTAYPYYISKTQLPVEDVTIEDGQTVTIVNDGNTDYFAVWKLYGPFLSLTLTNNSVVDLDGNPLVFVYDSDLPSETPGELIVDDGDYVEVIFFMGSAYLNGNLANRKAGVDMRFTEFFPMVPGNNDIEATFLGADTTDTRAVCLMNSAWA